jgi:quercetin dioxygenase-like cupin family protein
LLSAARLGGHSQTPPRDAARGAERPGNSSHRPCRAVCDKEVFVERFRFDPDSAFTPRDELLDSVTVAPLSAPSSERSPFQAAVFRFAPGGRIARHPAGSGQQILAVLEGSGEVSGASGVDEPIEAGEAVFWREGEEHELKTTGGLTALIIEGRDLDRFRGSG